ncbi:sigma factor binding protein 1, chloroplastic [Cicer arietinum]|uniref:Sigma factor binding protein 1, chloroplastic n=1 Tax=Cicer arietinum TaxID=3827 RepID=A0A1S2XRI8_CICAR|nr:sigma factor binding protein 1, chloroplastic [Cicer arietinum]
MDTINSSTITTMQQIKTPPTKITKPNKKKNNNNKNPIKVVYISNPMKVKTSASEFRALVQELTGQYAESPPDPSKFQESGSDNISDGRSENRMDLVKNYDGEVVVGPPQVDPDQVKPSGEGSYEGFDDDVWMAEMVENIWDLLPSSAFCESFQLDH